MGTSPEATNPMQIKWICVEVPDTADDGDVVEINIANHGITTMWDVMMWTHSTTDDIIITETTEVVTRLSALTSGQLDVTVQGTTDNKKRVILIGGI